MFNKINDAAPPYDEWVEDLKIRCGLYDMPVPNRKELRANHKIETKKEVYEGLGYRLKVTRNLSGMPYRDTPAIVNLINDHLIWVEISRLDELPVTSWEDKQKIKNFIGGEDVEGVELYPATDRALYDGQSCHLWIMKRNDAFFPFGFPASISKIKEKIKEEADAT